MDHHPTATLIIILLVICAAIAAHTPPAKLVTFKQRHINDNSLWRKFGQIEFIKIPLEYDNEKTTLFIRRNARGLGVDRDETDMYLLKQKINRHEQTSQITGYDYDFDPAHDIHMVEDPYVLSATLVLPSNGVLNAKIDKVGTILEADKYVYDIKNVGGGGGQPNPFLTKQSKINLEWVLKLFLSVCRAMGVKKVTLTDKSKFPSNYKKGNKHNSYLMIDTKILRGFQGKSKQASPSIYSNAGFKYLNADTLNAVYNALKYLHLMTAKQVYDAVMKLDDNEADRDKIYKCFREYLNIKIKKDDRKDESFKEKVDTKFGVQMSQLWLKRKDGSQQCYVDIVEILKRTELWTANSLSGIVRATQTVKGVNMKIDDISKQTFLCYGNKLPSVTIGGHVYNNAHIEFANNYLYVQYNIDQLMDDIESEKERINYIENEIEKDRERIFI